MYRIISHFFLCTLFCTAVLVVWLGGDLRGWTNYLFGWLGALGVVSATLFSFHRLVRRKAQTMAQEEGLPAEMPQGEDAFGETVEKRQSTLFERAGRIGWAFSLYRLGAYGALFYSIVWLVQKGLFWPIFYLLGSSVAIVGIVMALWLNRQSTVPQK